MRRPASPAASRTARLAPSTSAAFRNNYVDNRPEKRYRELESFPGFEIDEIAARRFAKLTGEVNLPPIRFAEVGTPRLLSSAMPARRCSRDDADAARRRREPPLHDVGGQVDLTFTVALRLPMVFSIGAARGFGDGYRRQDRIARFAENHVGDRP